MIDVLKPLPLMLLLPPDWLLPLSSIGPNHGGVTGADYASIQQVKTICKGSIEKQNVAPRSKHW